MKLRVNKKRVEWEGGGLDLPVRAMEAVRLGDRVLVVHDYAAYSRRKPALNLVAYSLGGERLWTAENLGYPDLGSTDAYTGILSEEPLWVYNGAGYRCRIDPETGKLLERQFTK